MIGTKTLTATAAETMMTAIVIIVRISTVKQIKDEYVTKHDNEASNENNTLAIAIIMIHSLLQNLRLCTCQAHRLSA